MRVRNFILADAVGGEGIYFLHGAGLERIQAHQFPHIHPTIGVLVTLVLEPGDKATESQLTIALVQEDGVAVDVLMQGKLALPEIPEDPDQGVSVINLVAQKIGLTVPRGGRHWVTLEVGEMELDRTALAVGALAPEQPVG
ncbi:MAG TPA: hypothetical protein VID48_12075 [Solirubrobacteraceae bacterium]